MNPEAVEWLESLDEWAHADLFKPVVASSGTIASLKDDHESCVFCPMARLGVGGELLVVG